MKKVKKTMRELANLFAINQASFNIEDAATVEEGILSFSEKVNADLIVMYTHGRKGIEHFFKGSVAEHVVNHSNVPVFTYVQH
jgi:nucleotide-binding universal stress UspA family protein